MRRRRRSLSVSCERENRWLERPRIQCADIIASIVWIDWLVCECTRLRRSLNGQNLLPPLAPPMTGSRLGREAVFWGQLEPGAAAPLGIYDIIFVFLFQIIMTDICFSLCEFVSIFPPPSCFCAFYWHRFFVWFVFPLFWGSVAASGRCADRTRGERQGNA